MTSFSLSLQKDPRPRTLAVDPLGWLNLFIHCLLTILQATEIPDECAQAAIQHLGGWSRNLKESKASLGYRAKPCLKMPKKPKETKTEIPALMETGFKWSDCQNQTHFQEALHGGKHKQLYSERHSVLHLGLHLRSTHLRAALDTFIPCPIFTIKPRDRTTSCGSQNIWNQVSKKLLSWDLPRILDSSRVMWMGR